MLRMYHLSSFNVSSQTCLPVCIIFSRLCCFSFSVSWQSVWYLLLNLLKLGLTLPFQSYSAMAAYLDFINLLNQSLCSFKRAAFWESMDFQGLEDDLRLGERDLSLRLRDRYLDRDEEEDGDLYFLCFFSFFSFFSFLLFFSFFSFLLRLLSELDSLEDLELLLSTFCFFGSTVGRYSMESQISLIFIGLFSTFLLVLSSQDLIMNIGSSQVLKKSSQIGLVICSLVICLVSFFSFPSVIFFPSKYSSAVFSAFPFHSYMKSSLQSWEAGMSPAFT